MSNDRFIPNSFQVPNALVDDLMAELGGVELKCYLLVIRKTKGWSKEFDAISLSQFVTFTGAGKTAVINALKNLVDAGLLVRKVGARNTSVYAINLFRNSTSSESELVQKVNIQKTILKNLKQMRFLPPAQTKQSGNFAAKSVRLKLVPQIKKMLRSLS